MCILIYFNVAIKLVFIYTIDLYKTTDFVVCVCVRCCKYGGLFLFNNLKLIC